MTAIKSIDKFIQLSHDLLIARPTTTRISTTYSHKQKKRASKRSNATDAKEASADQPQQGSAVAIVKTFDPVSGVCLKLKLSKINQLNRVLSALGPRGVQVDDKQVVGFAEVLSGKKSEASA
ncbi:similar to Saccharomyces cerevisiae YKL122C SRP21 Subunit of the signal recognition particle (SRP) [Geotrichum candidum]|uniref:Similar to Saccharomyces cerevisiae YKL122C SRP21 Subunit of the signal recognition particle (SRP) n=1 Tax=Geotrichum candidum TaxID=1173061 RepID=A0A0J9X7H3_GEOCN|nr:similar to Saccharomyces cerevisiae YKL122C SRP21 Subunit of the signal recognition particle (SRP) [Geotrichum candidum]